MALARSCNNQAGNFGIRGEFYFIRNSSLAKRQWDVAFQPQILLDGRSFLENFLVVPLHNHHYNCGQSINSGSETIGR